MVTSEAMRLPKKAVGVSFTAALAAGEFGSEGSSFEHAGREGLHMD
jgi:hypothetical protein